MRQMKTKICQCCNKEFRQFIRKDGKSLNLSRRRYCLDCSPFGTYDRRHPDDRTPIKDGFKICTKCKTLLPIDQFVKRSKMSAHIHHACKSCERVRQLGYAKALKQKAIDYKGGKCSICGYAKCNNSLAFHHRDPKEKSFSVGKRGFIKWSTLQRELDKCDLLCANCHGEIHS